MTLCVFGDTSKTSSAQVTALWEVTGLPLPSCKLRWNKWVHMYTRARVRAKQKPLLTNKKAGWCQSSRYLSKLKEEENPSYTEETLSQNTQTNQQKPWSKGLTGHRSRATLTPAQVRTHWWTQNSGIFPLITSVAQNQDMKWWSWIFGGEQGKPKAGVQGYSHTLLCQTEHQHHHTPKSWQEMESF